MSKLNFQNIVWKEDRSYVAWNLNTMVFSFGDTKEEALKSLEEALELHLEDNNIFIHKIEQPAIVSMYA